MQRARNDSHVDFLCSCSGPEAAKDMLGCVVVMPFTGGRNEEQGAVRGTSVLRVLLGLLAVSGCGLIDPGNGGSNSQGGGGAAVSGGAGGADGGAAQGGSAQGGSGGLGEAGLGGDAGSTTSDDALIDGSWAVIGFADPAAMTLDGRNGQVTGYGCCAGLSEDSLVSCCGVAAGTLQGQVLQFQMGLGDFTPDTYKVEMLVAADGSRMTGSIGLHSPGYGPAAMVPLEVPGETGWIVPGDPPLRDALPAPVGGFSVRLSTPNPTTTAYSPDTEYWLGLDGGGALVLSGALGAFWEGEMQWDASNLTLTAGPVTETDPALPVQVVLHFDGPSVASVAATMPSGEVLEFVAE